jgi:DNA-binding transcriptional LysR family regulator
MDLKLFEDLVALARERSFVRAAEARHVTHPAFGRRIRALEAWAGAALVDRGRSPVQLTEAGQALLQHVRGTLDDLAQAREQLRSRQGDVSGSVFRLATGRTLARTSVADWLAALAKPRQPLHGQKVDLSTRSMADVVLMLERGEVDMVCCYEHPATSVRLSGQRYRHVTLVRDHLVPVSRVDAQGRPMHGLDGGALLVYAASLSLGALLHDHLRRNVPGAGMRTRFVCDSADAIHEFVRRGMGAAWLPWSIVSSECRSGDLTVLGGRSDEVPFDVRLYRPRARQTALVEAVWAVVDR